MAQFIPVRVADPVPMLSDPLQQRHQLSTLTLRNVPEALVARLMERAQQNRRSHLLKGGDGFAGEAAAVESRAAALARIREIQARFPGARTFWPDPRSAEEIQARLDHFAELRSHFKGSPLGSEAILEAIGRDSHPPNLPDFVAKQTGKT